MSKNQHITDNPGENQKDFCREIHDEMSSDYTKSSVIIIHFMLT